MPTTIFFWTISSEIIPGECASRLSRVAQRVIQICLEFPPSESNAKDLSILLGVEEYINVSGESCQKELNIISTLPNCLFFATLEYFAFFIQIYAGENPFLDSLKLKKFHIQGIILQFG